MAMLGETLKSEYYRGLLWRLKNLNKTRGTASEALINEAKAEIGALRSDATKLETALSKVMPVTAVAHHNV